jgi:hypothetical protein
MGPCRQWVYGASVATQTRETAGHCGSWAIALRLMTRYRTAKPPVGSERHMSLIDSCVVSWLGLQGAGGVDGGGYDDIPGRDVVMCHLPSNHNTTTLWACQEQVVDVKASILFSENRYFMRAGAPISMRCQGPPTKADPPKRMGSEAGLLPGRPRPLLRQERPQRWSSESTALGASGTWCLSCWLPIRSNSVMTGLTQRREKNSYLSTERTK